MKFSRRLFIRILAGTFIIGSIAVIRTLVSGIPTAEQTIIKIVGTKLPYLSHSQAELRKFASAFNERERIHRRSDLWGFLIAFAAFPGGFTAAGIIHRINGTHDHFQRFGDIVAESYLLSSDFFYNGANEKRTIHFRTFYHPRSACSNPFWEADQPSGPASLI